MKKLRTFTAVSLLMLFAGMSDCQACGWGPFWMPADIDIYRIMPYFAEGNYRYVHKSFVDDNCQLWFDAVRSSKTNGPLPGKEDIRTAIYDFDFADWTAIRQNTGNGKPFKNSFVRCLLQNGDGDAVNLLYWSKSYEEIIMQQNSPWYYGCEVNETIAEIADSAIACVKSGTRYKDRYLFLAIKALYSMKSFHEAVMLWDKEKHRIPQGAIYDRIEGYVAGCMHGIGRDEEAMRIYVRLGDLESLQFVGKNMSIVCTMIFEQKPNSDYFRSELQRMLLDLENYNVYHNATSTRLDSSDFARMLALSLRACTDKRVENKAMWRYVAAALLDYTGQPEAALRKLEGAENGCKDTFLSNSIRILRLYLYSRTAKVDKAYVKHLFQEIKWLDALLVSEVESLGGERHRLGNITNYHYSTLRTVYANDAMRRMLLSPEGACKRLLQAGYTVRALQFANMAENRFFQLFPKGFRNRYRNEQTLYAEWHDDYMETPFEHSIYYMVPLTGKPSVGGRPEEYNSHDFSNEMFLMADRLSADQIMEYWQRVEKPKDEMDAFLNERSYTSSDYWLDIVGTHLLREFRYDDAVVCFEKTSPRYQKKLNVKFRLDPFLPTNVANPARYRGSNARLDFARRMARLGKTFTTDVDINARASAMIDYAIGLRNSAGQCWSLVSYGRYSYLNPYTESDTDYYYSPEACCWLNTVRYRTRASALSDSLQEKALLMFTDREAAAKAWRLLGDRKRVVDWYPETSSARDIIRHCDTWRDYVSRPSGRRVSVAASSGFLCASPAPKRLLLPYSNLRY